MVTLIPRMVRPAGDSFLLLRCREPSALRRNANAAKTLTRNHATACAVGRLAFKPPRRDVGIPPYPVQHSVKAHAKSKIHVMLRLCRSISRMVAVAIVTAHLSTGGIPRRLGMTLI